MTSLLTRPKTLRKKKNKQGITQGQNYLDFRTVEFKLRTWTNFGTNRCSTLKIVSVAVANFTDIKKLIFWLQN